MSGAQKECDVHFMETNEICMMQPAKVSSMLFSGMSFPGLAKVRKFSSEVEAST